MARSQRERKWRLLSDAAGAAARRGPGDTRHNHVYTICVYRIRLYMNINIFPCDQHSCQEESGGLEGPPGAVIDWLIH